ncbi:MAG: trypsin-like serine peptidase [Pseudooceanicola atlanticus]
MTRLPLLLLALAGPAIAQDDTIRPGPVLEAYVDGLIEARDIRIGAAERTGPSPVPWSDEISVPGSDYIRLHLRVEGPPFPPDATLRLLGALDQDVAIPLDQVGPDGMWSDLMPFGRARIALVAPTPIDPQSTLFIDQLMMQSTKITPYSVHGINQLTPINDAAVPAGLRALGAPVAFLSFIEGGFARTCSGFLIGPDRLMTNEHCINSAATCASMTAVFGYEFDTEGRLGMGPQLRCRDFEAAQVNVTLDASIVTLTGAPGPEYGQVDLAMLGDPADGPMVVIQHPGPQPKQISYLECDAGETRIAGRGPETDFTHTCDTAGGSSGAPIFDVTGRLVGLHHFGFQDGEAWDSNRGVHADRIQDWLTPDTTAAPAEPPPE